MIALAKTGVAANAATNTRARRTTLRFHRSKPCPATFVRDELTTETSAYDTAALSKTLAWASVPE
jgi:hypothetical protein